MRIVDAQLVVWFYVEAIEPNTVVDIIFVVYQAVDVAGLIEGKSIHGLREHNCVIYP